MIKIRMAQGGRTHMPIYTVVAADQRDPRDGRFLEKLGQYNPHKAEGGLIDLKPERIKYWMDQGAQMSDTVRTLLKKNKVTLQ